MQNKTLIWRQMTPVRSVTFTLGNQLILSGCRFRPRRQMPVLGGSQGATARDIVGSVRELTIRNGALCGNLRWASDPEAQAVRQKFEDGHLHFRLNTEELEVCVLRSSEELAGIRGPARVVLSWTPVSVALEAGGE